MVCLEDYLKKVIIECWCVFACVSIDTSLIAQCSPHHSLRLYLWTPTKQHTYVYMFVPDKHLKSKFKEDHIKKLCALYMLLCVCMIRLMCTLSGHENRKELKAKSNVNREQREEDLDEGKDQDRNNTEDKHAQDLIIWIIEAS